MNFTEIEAGEIHVGLPMHMMFRIKDHDPLHGAAPCRIDVGLKCCGQPIGAGGA